MTMLLQYFKLYQELKRLAYLALRTIDLLYMFCPDLVPT